MDIHGRDGSSSRSNQQPLSHFDSGHGIHMHGWKIKPNNLLLKRVLLSSDENVKTREHGGWGHGFEDAGGSIMVAVVDDKAEAAM